MSFGTPQRFSPSSGSEGGVSPRHENLRNKSPYDTKNWANTSADMAAPLTPKKGGNTDVRRGNNSYRMEPAAGNNKAPDSNSADEEDLDLESFQQKVSELFTQYTEGITIHKMDLRDLLEDVGYNITMEALWEVVKDLGLGIPADGAKVKDTDKNKSDLKMPSQFDIEDTIAICSHLYNVRHFVRQDQDDSYVTEVEIELHKYAWLLLTCSKSPTATYKIIRPKFLKLNLTPKALLELGAGVVLTVMCALLLAVCCSLWVKIIKDSERDDALTTVRQFVTIAEAFVDNQAPLQQCGEDATYIGGLMEEEFKQLRNDEAAHLAQLGQSIATFTGVALNYPGQEIAVISTLLQTAATTAEVLISTSANGGSPTVQRAVFDKTLLAILMTQRRTVGPPYYAATVASDWDFVVINTTDQSDATRVWALPNAECAHSSDTPCAFRQTRCSSYSSTALLDDSDDIVDEESEISTFSDNTISLESNTFGATPIPNVKGAVVAAHLPFFSGGGLTICFFKPKVSFDIKIRRSLPSFYLNAFDLTVKSKLSLPVTPNMIQYDVATKLSMPVTPALTVKPIEKPCTRADGCERNGAFKTAITTVVGNCTAYRSTSLSRLTSTMSLDPTTNPMATCNASSLAYEAFDNSSTSVICAATPFGSHYNFAVTDTALMLCIDRALIKQRVVDLYIWAINNYNVKYSMTTTFEMVLAVRNESTGIIIPQVTDYAFGNGPRPCYDFCQRSVRSSVGARAVFANKASYVESAIDYRPEPVLQGYTYVPSLDVAFGEERDVVNVGWQVFGALIAMVDAYNRDLDHITLVPLTNMLTYEPIEQFNVHDPCPNGYECYTRSIGVVYRGDCDDCSRILGLGSPRLAAPQFDCTGDCANAISRMPIYQRPFMLGMASTDGSLTEEVSYVGRKSLYAPIYIRKLGLGFGMHFFTEERMSSAYRIIYAGIGASVAILLGGILGIRLFARNNLKHVQNDWVKYRHSIQKQKREFRNIVGDVVPPLYAPLLFVPTSVMSERLNITTIFVNLVGYQRFIGEQDADFVHDYTSYSFYAMNLLTKYYRFFKVKTFGDNFMIVGGVNKQVRERSAVIRKMLGTEVAGADNDDDETFGHEEDNDDEVISRCVEASAVLLQLFSYLYVHNPQSVPFLKKRVKSRQLTDMTQLRIGIATGPTNLIMTRHSGFPYFLALSEHAAVSYRLQQAAKSNTINISRDVRMALTRSGRDSKFHFGKETALMHKKIAVTASTITKANVPIPPALLEALRVTRAPVRYAFSNEGGIPMVTLATSSSTQSGQSGQQSTVVGGGHGRY